MVPDTWDDNSPNVVCFIYSNTSMNIYIYLSDVKKLLDFTFYVSLL